MPDWRAEVRRRLEPLRLEAGAEALLVEEMAEHLADRFRDLRNSGAGEDEAYDQTIAELDDLYPLRASLQRSDRMPTRETPGAGQASPGNWLEGTWQDVRYATRSMRKSPVFVLFVVLTLALGIGANTTVFTLINTLVLNPLPVRNAGELAAIGAVDGQSTSESGALFPLSYPDLKDYQTRSATFSSLGGFTSVRGVTWLNHGESQGMFCEAVTGNYFSTLGLTAVRGRFFTQEEDGIPGTHAVAVLNYATWQKNFGGAADIVGRQIDVNSI